MEKRFEVKGHGPEQCLYTYTHLGFEGLLMLLSFQPLDLLLTDATQSVGSDVDKLVVTRTPAVKVYQHLLCLSILLHRFGSVPSECVCICMVGYIYIRACTQSQAHTHTLSLSLSFITLVKPYRQTHCTHTISRICPWPPLSCQPQRLPVCLEPAELAAYCSPPTPPPFMREYEYEYPFSGH